MHPEAAQRGLPREAHPWSQEFTARMLLVVCLASPLVGGAVASLVLVQLSESNMFSGADGSLHRSLLLLGAASASLLLGPFFWWLCILRPHRLTTRRGVLVGMLSSLVAHPVMWLFAMDVTYLASRTNHFTLSLESLTYFSDALPAACFFSACSLLLVGWFTTLVGGIAGGVIAWVLAYLAERDQRLPPV